MKSPIVYNLIDEFYFFLPILFAIYQTLRLNEYKRNYNCDPSLNSASSSTSTSTEFGIILFKQATQ